MMPINILCGPIIGKVTNDSINIMLEVNKNVTDLECSLTSLSVNKSDSKTLVNKLNFTGNIPRGYAFIKLLPATIYKFTITDLRVPEEERRSRTGLVKTMEISPSIFRVICTSNGSTVCVTTTEQKEVSKDSSKIVSEIKNIDNIAEINPLDVECVLHLGNQVNVESGLTSYFKDVTNITKVKSLPLLEREEFIKEVIREIYRSAWNTDIMKKILSSFQNLMIWSEKDSLTNGLKNIDLGVNIISLSHDIYREYQRQLWDLDYFSKSNKPREFHYHSYAFFGIFIFDFRGNRLKNYVHNSPVEVLGKTQKQHLKKFLSMDFKTVLMCSEYSFINKLPKEDSSIIDSIKSIFLTQSPDNNQKTILDEWGNTNKDLYTIYKFLEKWSINNKNKKMLFASGNNSMIGNGEIFINNRHAGIVTKHLLCGIERGGSSKALNMRYKRWDIMYRPSTTYSSVLIEINKDQRILDKPISFYKLTPTVNVATILSTPTHRTNKIEEMGTILTKFKKLYDDDIPTSSPENTGNSPGEDDESPTSTIWHPISKNIKKDKEVARVASESVLTVPMSILKTPINPITKEDIARDKLQENEYKEEKKDKKEKKDSKFDKDYKEILDLLDDGDDGTDSDPPTERATKPDKRASVVYEDNRTDNIKYNFVDSDEEEKTDKNNLRSQKFTLVKKR